MSVTQADNHVTAVIELLKAEPDSTWSVSGSPRIKEFWDDATSERGPGADQPPVIYVHSPTGSSLDRHSMDGLLFNRGNTAQIQIFSLSKSQVVDVQADVVRVLSEYLDDNRTQTPFIDLAPTQASDFREQKPSRITNHYVTRVTVETVNLTDTGKLTK